MIKNTHANSLNEKRHRWLELQTEGAWRRLQQSHYFRYRISLLLSIQYLAMLYRLVGTRPDRAPYIIHYFTRLMEKNWIVVVSFLVSFPCA